MTRLLPTTPNRRWSHRAFACLLALTTLACTILPGASASASSDALGLGLRAVVKGDDKPAITLNPDAALKGLSIVLTRGDGVVQKLKSGALRAGASKVLTFKQPVGVFTYVAAFDVKWADGTGSQFETTFSATRVGELALQIGPGDVDMDERTLKFKITNPAASAELVILGARGKRIGYASADYEAAPPGEELELTWDAVEGDIVRMDLKVTDIAGFWTGMQITPFSIEIPHDEVQFASGRHEVTDSEAPKLAKTMGHIEAALKEHGTLLSLKLFVAGFTDTVGNHAYNLDLSRRRARAIAAWYRARGLKIPIFYQGFGEGVLAVKTPDETDEPANRRAVYVLSGQIPQGAAFPGGGWKRL